MSGRLDWTWMAWGLSLFTHLIILLTLFFGRGFVGLTGSNVLTSPRAILVGQNEEWLRQYLDSRPVVQTQTPPSSRDLSVDSQQVARYRGEKTVRVAKETIARGSEGLKNLGLSAGLGLGAADLIDANLQQQGNALHFGEGKTNVASRSGGSGQLRSSNDLVDPNLTLGAETFLNTDEYVYASFFNRMKRDIAAWWEPGVHQFLYSRPRRLAPGQYLTQTEIQIDRMGDILDVKLLRTSGVEGLDRVALKAIYDVARLPNPPQELLESDGHLRIKFGFMLVIKNQSVDVRYLPDPRFLEP